MAVIAFDFDGTCVTHEYPAVGSDIGAAPVLRELAENNHRLILYTMRSEKELVDAVTWCRLNKIPLWDVNNNPEQAKWSSSRKIYAHLYIDDAALGVPLKKGRHARPYVDWQKVREYLVKNDFIKEI